MQQRLWVIVHHVIAHPLMALGTRWGDRFHDWTAEKAWGDGE